MRQSRVIQGESLNRINRRQRRIGDVSRATVSEMGAS